MKTVMKKRNNQISTWQDPQKAQVNSGLDIPIIFDLNVHALLTTIVSLLVKYFLSQQHYNMTSFNEGLI